MMIGNTYSNGVFRFLLLVCKVIVAMVLVVMIIANPPPDMVSIPAGPFNFAVNGVEIEGDDAHGVDVQVCIFIENSHISV